MLHNAFVRVDDINYWYGKRQVLENIGFTVGKGEILGLLGTNGAGKTTLIDILTGLKKCQSGKIEIFGTQDVGSSYVRSRSGIALQYTGLYPELTIDQTLEFFSRISSRKDSIDRVLEITDLSKLRMQKISSLSGGERRRVDLALAIWGDPELLILDEPTAGLDYESRKRLWNIIVEMQNQGSAIILATHHLDEAQLLSDHIVIIHQGKIMLTGDMNTILHTLPAKLMVKADIPSDSGLFTHLPQGIILSSQFMPKSDFNHIFSCKDQQKLIEWFCHISQKENIHYDKLYTNLATLEEVFDHIVQVKEQNYMLIPQ